MNRAPPPAVKDGISRHRWLILRRLSQAAIMLLFLAGPLFGYWIAKGNLNYSVTLGVLSLADPFVLLQSIAAGHRPRGTALLGASIVIGAYLVLGGRTYCSWVCPVNMVTDAAAWLRARLGLHGGGRLSRRARYWVLVATLATSAASGTVAWELVNPVSALHRGIIFGMGAGWTIITAVFLLDLFFASRAWCGHLCPTGAFYGLLGKLRLLRIAATGRSRCDDCALCYAVCPEPRVIKPALKGPDDQVSSSHCTNCGRCIDVCPNDVFAFSITARRPGERPRTQNHVRSIP